MVRMLDDDFEAEVQNNIREYAFGVHSISLLSRSETPQQAVFQIVTLEQEILTIVMNSHGYKVCS